MSENCTLVVRNVANISVGVLTHIFEGYGVLQKCEVKKALEVDTVYGVVVFADQRDAQLALQNENGRNMQGMFINIHCTNECLTSVSDLQAELLVLRKTLTSFYADKKLKEFRRGVADFLDVIAVASKVQDERPLSFFDLAVIERVKGSTDRSYFQWQEQVNRIKAIKNSDVHLRPTAMLLERISVTSPEKEQTLLETNCSIESFDAFLRQAREALDYINCYRSPRQRSRARHSSSESRSESRQFRRRIRRGQRRMETE